MNSLLIVALNSANWLGVHNLSLIKSIKIDESEFFYEFGIKIAVVWQIVYDISVYSVFLAWGKLFLKTRKTNFTLLIHK